MTVDIKVQARIPKELLRDFCQWLRDWDVKHDPQHNRKDIELAYIFRSVGKESISDEEAKSILRSLKPPVGDTIIRFKLEETGWPMDKKDLDS